MLRFFRLWLEALILTFRSRQALLLENLALRQPLAVSATIWKIRSRTCLEILFLPACFRTLEITLQYNRKPFRCQRTTVSGVTRRRDFFQPDQNRRAATQKSLSSTSSWGRGCLRFRIAQQLREAFPYESIPRFSSSIMMQSMGSKFRRRFDP